MNFDGLNENQRRAVEWDSGPLLVLAGPGSGKTRVLTVRIAKILEDSAGKSFRVLALTFTNKAADEMRDRLTAMVPATERALLTTFHAFCADVLRQHGSHVGTRPDFTILNQKSDQVAVLVEVVRRLAPETENPGRIAEQYRERIEECLDAFCKPEDVPPRYKDPKFGNNVRLLYDGYRQELASRNALDFPSLILLTHELFIAKPAVAKQFRIIYQHFCVDEFQDTNLAQYTVLRQVLGDQPKNLFVVADDDQIIYQFNGASPQRLHQIRADYKMEVIQLPTNYRCPAAVIDLANNLIRFNLDRSADKQPLVAHKAPCDHNPVYLQRLKSQDVETAWVASHIYERGQEQWGHCAVLARARWLLEPLVKALGELGVSAVISARKDEFRSPPYRWLHSALRLANNRQDREQLNRVRKSFYDIEGLDIDLQLPPLDAKDPSTDLLRDWVAAALSRRQLEPRTREIFSRIRPIVAGDFDTERFIEESIAWFETAIKLDDVAMRDGFEDYPEEVIAWRELLRSTRSKYAGDAIGLSVLLQEFDLCSKTPPAPPEAVRCFTVHAAKGMEFEHVYVIGLNETKMPSRQSIEKGDQSDEMREERRNCFVAITRTQSSLTITYAGNQRPSRFLLEMGLIG
jgi:DNA helicase II / ATP-dependent DNA helicase PcrA